MTTGRSRRYQKLVGERPKEVQELRDALTLLQKMDGAKFDESIEVAMNLGVNPKNSDQQVRGSIALPHGTGKSVRVLVFAQGEQAAAAEAAGADFVGDEDLIEKIKNGWLDFDAVVATPPMMSKVSKVAKILGPRGLMPNPKLGTVAMNVADVVKNQKKGMVEYRTDKGGVIHSAIGKKSFSLDALCENFDALVQAVIRSKPPSVKGQYVRSIFVSPTMGPSIAVKKVV